MGGLHAVEDRPTPKEVYNWRLYTEALIIATGSLLFGYDSAFVGTTIARASFKKDFSITKATAAGISSNITSAFQAGAFFGALFCYFLTERVGRKWALQANVVVYLVGAVLMTVATHQLSFIYAGRVLTGLGCGAITATVPSYIAELSVPSIRGILTGLFEVAYQVGSLIGFCVNYGINKNMNVKSSLSWRIPMAIQLIPAAILLAGGFFLHESPLWLMRKGREAEAKAALVQLRHLPVEHEYLQEDVQDMQSRLDEEAAIAARYGRGSLAFIRGCLNELSRSGMRNRVLLVFCAFALQNLSGASAINYYSPTLFGSLGVTDIPLYTGIYGLVKAVASIIYYIFFVDMLGRRNPVLVSSIACSLCLWFVGAYVKVGHPASAIAAGEPLSASTAAGGRAAIGMIMIYSIFWSFGLNGIPWIVSAEIFPGSLRVLTGTYAALCQWLVQFVMTKALPYIFSSFGYGTWFFFAAWMLTATLWTFFFMPETKGLTIDRMDALFGYQGHARADDVEIGLQMARAQDDIQTIQNEDQFLLDYFVHSTVPPILAPVETQQQWSSMRRHLLVMARESSMVHSALLSFSDLLLRRRRQHIRTTTGGQRHHQDSTRELSRYTASTETSQPRREHLLATCFFLSYVDILEGRTEAAHGSLKIAYHIFDKGEKTSFGPLEIRILSWIRLLDGRAVSAGGEGLFLSDDEASEMLVQPSPAGLDSLPGDLGPSNDADQGAEIEDALFQALYQPGAVFFQKVQSFMGRISKIDPWHRSRGTVADETEVMIIAAKITRDLDKLFDSRPRLMDYAAKGQLTPQHLSPHLSHTITRVFRTYATMETVLALAKIKELAKMMVDTPSESGIEGGEPLPVNMLWPLLMLGSEEEDPHERIWIRNQICRMQEVATNAEMTAQVLDEVQKMQDLTKTRVDIRSIMHKIFDACFAIV
ncbi:general substrate transporter, partial [Aureobasidium melanogenum]